MSEAERKSAARAAFAEGVDFQERRDCVQALSQLETAQRLFDAPTHLLHIAQCQAQPGRLVEAQESYAKLAHMTLDPKAPPQNIRTSAKVHLEKQGEGFHIPRIELTTEVRATGGDEAKFKMVADETKKACPVSKLLKAEIALDAKLVTG